MTQFSSVSVCLQLSSVRQMFYNYHVMNDKNGMCFVGCGTHLSSASTCMANVCNDNVIHHQAVSYSIIVRDHTKPYPFIIALQREFNLNPK